MGGEGLYAMNECKGNERVDGCVGMYGGWVSGEVWFAIREEGTGSMI